MRWRIPLLGLVLLLVGGQLSAQDVCQVQGLWQIESLTIDGEARELGDGKMIKLVTASHFAWQDVPEVADTLGAFPDSRYGGGTYRVTETTYTESLDYFVDPEFVGQDLTFSCRVEGELWYHDREYPILEDGQPTGSMQVAEVWRRIE
jgi:hypothetical protein